ncbi:MAG: hypothetical protein OXC00_15905 [Acidimicrobiaceae bacterium]|nr:hypothetical protein [Acidimicrobiaceae bacterium]
MGMHVKYRCLPWAERVIAHIDGFNLLIWLLAPDPRTVIQP